MRLAHRRVIFRLERILSSILKGVPLKEWAEHVVSQLLGSAGQTGPPVDLLSNALLRERRIVKVRYYKTHLPVWGRLVPEDEGFAAELFLPHKSRGFWNRFALAHEIAHTFFYDLREWPPTPLSYLEPGNRDLEWLCGYLGKCLMLPASWLRHQIEHYPKLGSKEFSPSVLELLGKTFSAPVQVVAERLVEDLGLWDCILLQFTMFGEVTRSSEKDWRSAWRLNWHTAAPDRTERLFIPVGRRMQDGVMKFPRAKGAIRRLIDDCMHNHQDGRFIAQKVHWKCLNASTTGNLGKFLHEALEADAIPVHVAVRTSLAKSMFDWIPSGDGAATLVMCFPLTRARGRRTGA